MLAKALSRYWWVAFVRGVVAIAFGFVAFAQPGLALMTFVLLFGAFAFIEGVMAIASAVGARKADEDWWVLLLEGVIGVLFGLLAFMRPVVTALTLLYLIAGWAIVVGALRITTAIYLRREITGEAWLATGGVLSILFGVLMFAAPGSGAIAAMYLIGFWAIVLGGSLCALGFKLRQLEHRERHVPTIQAPAP